MSGEDSIIPIGSVVRLHGLTDAEHLNGTYGEVIRKGDGWAGDRLGVKLFDAPIGEHDEKALKPDNLVEVPHYFKIQEGSLVRFGGFKPSQETPHFCFINHDFGKVRYKNEKDGRYHVDVDGKFATFSVPRENMTPLAAELEPGRPLLEKGDEGGLLEFIRTTKICDEDLSYDFAKKCYEFAYKNAPENFVHRWSREKFDKPNMLPRNARRRTTSAKFLIQGLEQNKVHRQQLISQRFRALNKQLFDELADDKRHVVWIAMHNIGHHIVMERLAGKQGWRLYQCLPLDKVFFEHYYDGHNHGHILPDNGDPLPGRMNPANGTRMGGFSALEWVSADPGRQFQSPLRGVAHPHAKWGKGAVLTIEQADSIFKICRDLEDVVARIVDRIWVQLGVGAVPKRNENSAFSKWNEKALKFRKDLVSIQLADSFIKGKMTQDEDGKIIVQLDRFKFQIATSLADEFDRLFVLLTGEFPTHMTYLHMLVFSNYTTNQAVADDGSMLGFSFRHTESSDGNIGFSVGTD